MRLIFFTLIIGIAASYAHGAGENVPTYHYNIEPGASLGSISQKFYKRSSLWKKIQIWNSIANPHKLSPGQTIVLLEKPIRDIHEVWQAYSIEETQQKTQRQPTADPPVPALAVEKPTQKDKNEKVRKNFLVSPSLGVSGIEYHETFSGHIDAIKGHLRLNIEYLIDKWNLELFSDALIYTNTFVNSRNNTKASLLDTHLGATYFLHPVPKPWLVGLTASGRYSSLFVSGGPMGYKSIYYPEAFLKFGYEFKSQNRILAFGKYIPFNTRIQNKRVRATDIAFGARWDHPILDKYFLTVQVDLSRSHARLVDLNVEVDLRTANLSVGLGF